MSNRCFFTFGYHASLEKMMHNCICNRVWENVHSIHIQFCSHGNYNECYIDLKRSGMIKEWWFYNP